MNDNNNNDDAATVDVSDDLEAFEKEFFLFKDDVVTSEDVPSADDVVENEDNEPEAVEAEDGDTGDTPAPDAEDDDAEEDEEEETPVFKVKRKKSAKERITELTAARHEAERRADELARRLEALEATAPKAKNDNEPGLRADQLPEGAPTPDDELEDGTPKYPLGEFDPKFIRDLTKFTINEEREAAREAEAQEREAARMREAEEDLADEWAQRLVAAKDELPDLATKAVELETTFRDIDPNYGKYLATTIMSMEFGPQVLNHLAHNIREAQQIVASGPTSATLALGRLEERFRSAVKAAPVEGPKLRSERRTQAPVPAPVLRGNGGTRRDIPDDTDDLDAFSDKFFQTPGVGRRR